MDVENEPRLATILSRFRSTYGKISGAESAESTGDRRSEVTENSSSAVLNAKPADRSEPESEQVVPAGLTALPQPEVPTAESAMAATALDWPVAPVFVSPTASCALKETGLSPELCGRLNELNVQHAFAVQTAVVPAVLAAHASLRPDPPASILVNSATGSGKTLAYAAPIVDCLRGRRIPRVRALVLVPTKVLIAQVQRTFDELGAPFGLRTAALRPERPLAREHALITAEPPDVLVCAPGRLVEHLRLAPALLADLKFLVVDEADRLVGQSFQNWQDEVSKAIDEGGSEGGGSGSVVDGITGWHRPPLRLVFSATLTRDPSKLASLRVNDGVAPPQLFVVGERQLDGRDEFALPPQLHERVVRVKSLAEKPLALVAELLQQCGSGRAVVFVRSNESAARLARLIELVAHGVFGQTVEAQRCSGEMRAQDRRKVLRAFADSDAGVLVCTDLIARGIDMHIDLVVNYDVPLGAREYVHRVGRTARAGNEGTATTLLAPAERKHFGAFQAAIARTELEETDAEVVADERYDAALRELGAEVKAA